MADGKAIAFREWRAKMRAGLADFRRYWRAVAARAWADTKAMFPFGQSPERAIGTVVITIVAWYLLYRIAGEAPVIENWNNFITGLMATIVVFSALYLINFIAAPHRIDRDRARTIADRDATIVDLEAKWQRRADLRQTADRIGELWRQGNMLLNDVLMGAMDETQFRLYAAQWINSVLALLNSAGLSEESIMFETLPTSVKKHFPNRSQETNAVMNDLDQRLGKLRNIWGRAERTATNASV